MYMLFFVYVPIEVLLCCTLVGACGPKAMNKILLSCYPVNGPDSKVHGADMGPIGGRHDIYTPRLRSFKRSPASRQPIANPSATSRRPIAEHIQPIGNQSPTSRQPVPDKSPIFMDSSRPPIANQSPTGRRLIADWLPIDLQLKSGGFDRTVVALAAADFWSQSSRRQVAVHVWPRL